MDQLSIFGQAGQSTGIPDDLLQYIPGVFSENESDILLRTLIRAVPWQQRSVSMYGKRVITPRLTAWYGDEKKSYAYSGLQFHPMPWTNELLSIRQKLRALVDVEFNSVLLNYYRDGKDSVAWHSDDEKELGPQPVIASVSLGAVRTFDIRRKLDHGVKFSVRLESGSLLVMKGELQQHWEHRVAKSLKETMPRINLTFRVIQ